MVNLLDHIAIMKKREMQLFFSSINTFKMTYVIYNKMKKRNGNSLIIRSELNGLVSKLGIKVVQSKFP